MREDFVTRLELELRGAAERQAGGARVTRRGRRPDLRRLAPVAVAAAALVAAAILGVAALRDDTTVPTHPAPQLVGHQALVGQGASIASGFGAVWVSDPSNGLVLRVDPRTRAVQARIKVGGEAVLNTGAGAVWALTLGQLLQIDPRDNRVVRRIPVPGPAFDVLPTEGGVWVVGPSVVARADPRRKQLEPPISVDRAGYVVGGWNTDGRTLYLMRGDDTLLAIDARTAKRLPNVRVATSGPIVAATNGTVIVAGETGMVALDTASGRVRWSRDLGAGSINNGVLSGTTLWVQATDRATRRDRLWRIDARSGRTEGTLTLPAFGAAGMATVGSQVWIVSLSGELVIAK
jgi:outer membrane protein assembly factor BamB